MVKTSIAEELKDAAKNGYAVGAFNIFNYVSASAVVRAAEECRKPVILQTSVGTVKYFGAKTLYAMLENLMNTAKVPVYLHLDHCTSVSFAKECVDAGWDSIMIDASKQPMKENIRMTREASDYAHQKGVQAEGEIGIIEGVEDEVHADSGILASYEDCVSFVEQTGVDLFAPALGTAHGVYKGEPVIQYDLAGQLSGTLEVPIVCHGGTGLSEQAFHRLIQNGISKINVSTALKHAFLDGAKDFVRNSPDDYTPLNLEKRVYESIKDVITEHIRIFSVMNAPD